jgi:SAM-dependent methyltransferase
MNTQAKATPYNGRFIAGDLGRHTTKRLISRLTDHPVLPQRYGEDWWLPFRAAIGDTIRRPGVAILDVGSGRRPTIPVRDRPAPCRYFGLDISAQELKLAPHGSYDEIFVASIVDHVPELDDRFDLVVCWQVLEHVKPLPLALENIRSYLRPGGRFVGQLSGRFSLFALLNRLVPHSVAKFGMKHLLGRDPQTVFPAHYHKCTSRALQLLSSDWATFSVLSRYRGASYFGFLPVLERGYLVYEEWTVHSDRHDLATHYFIVAER